MWGPYRPSLVLLQCLLLELYAILLPVFIQICWGNGMILLLFLGQELHDPESLVRTGANSAAHGDGREKSCPVVFLKPFTCIRFLLKDVQMSVFGWEVNRGIETLHQGSWTNFSRKISSFFFFFFLNLMETLLVCRTWSFATVERATDIP